MRIFFDIKKMAEFLKPIISKPYTIVVNHNSE